MDAVLGPPETAGRRRLPHGPAPRPRTAAPAPPRAARRAGAGSAGLARAASATSASGCTSRPPRPSASRASTPSSPSPSDPPSCTSATTSRVVPRGAEELCAALSREVGPPGEPHGNATWLRSPCLGLCEQAPAASSWRSRARRRPSTRSADASPERVRAALERGDAPVRAGAPVPQRDLPGAPSLRLLRRVGVVDPTSLDDYRARGGYARCAARSRSVRCRSCGR